MTTKKSPLSILGGLILVILSVSAAMTLLFPWLRRRAPVSVPASDNNKLLLRQIAPYRHYSRRNPNHYMG